SQLPGDIRKIIEERQDIFTTGVLFNEVASRNFGSVDELRNHIQELIRDNERGSNTSNGIDTAVENSQDSGGKAKSQLRKSRYVDPVLVEEIVGRICNNLPVKVKVKGTQDKGQITINYASREQLEQLLTQFQK